MYRLSPRSEWPSTHSPLSSRGLGRRILSPETGVRIPVAGTSWQEAGSGSARIVLGGNADQIGTHFQRMKRTILVGLAVGALIALITIPFLGRYGWDRDELYYLTASHHLAFGYVDFPPLIALLAWLVHAVFGDSLDALRLVSLSLRDRLGRPRGADGAGDWRRDTGAGRGGARLGDNPVRPRLSQHLPPDLGSTCSPGAPSSTSPC